MLLKHGWICSILLEGAWKYFGVGDIVNVTHFSGDNDTFTHSFLLFYPLCTIRPCLHPPQLTNSPISKRSVFFTHTTSKPIILGTHPFNCCQTVLFETPQRPHNHHAYRSDTTVTCVNGFCHLLLSMYHYTHSDHTSSPLSKVGCVMISVVCVRLHVIFAHGFQSSQKSIFTFLWGNKNERHLQTKNVKTSTTNFHQPIFTHHFDRHAFLSCDTHKHPLKFTHLISPTYFHPRIFTHQFYPHFSTYPFPPTFVHPLFFHPHRFLSPAVPQKSVFTHDFWRSGFTHLQISPTCRFHPLADFSYL